MGKITKKGIFFTFIAITIIAVFILVFTPQAEVSLQVDTEATRARIGSIDNYVNDLQGRYFETVLRATTYKTILALIFYMNSTDSFLTNLDSAFQEVSINGTINNVPIDSRTNKKIMENSTLTNWSNKIIETAKDTLNVNTTLLIKNVTIFQTRPWNIESQLILNFTVKSNIAEWHKESIITTTISIEGLHDPYYLVNTDGKYTNQIKRSNVEFNKWNITKVRESLRNGTYVHWQDSEAPSFLMRFTNTIKNSSCCGIESFVDPNKISPNDQRESYVDYMFWSHKFANNCAELYNITNPSTGGGLWDEFRYFKLDINSTTRYNITGKDAVKTC